MQMHCVFIFLSLLLNLLQYCCFCLIFLFCLFCFALPGAYGILAPQAGIELTPQALEGEVLTH